MPKKILVVDDEPELVDVLTLRLESKGYEVVSGSNGEEALEKTKEENPDLIVMDVMMPPPNGFQVCRILKDDSQYKNIPILLLTAKAAEGDKSLGRESGADDYITKPYQADNLLAKIEEHLAA